jgi:phosphate transport system substrate-binding protein
MINHNSRWARIAVALVLLYLVGIDVTYADTLTLQGSTTFDTAFLATQRQAIETKSGHALQVMPNRSSLGLIALLEGRADLAMISATLESETAILRESQPDLPYGRLRSFAIATVSSAIIVHPTNPIKTIELSALRKVLLGEIVNWRELGGDDRPIRVVAIRPGGGVLATVEAKVLGAARHISAPDAIRVPVGTQVVKVVEQEEGAIGLTQLSMIRNRHVAEMIPNEPIEQILSLVCLDDPTPAAQAVIDAARSLARHADQRTP